MSFVGRGPMLAALRTAVDEVVRGRGRIILLAGEPGIGKTALAAEASEYARRCGVATAWGACWDGDGVPAFWPWRRVFASLSQPADVNWLDDVDDAVEGVDARFRVFAAVTSGLEAEAARQPLMVLLDDLHWADPGSLRLLAFVARQLRSAPVLVVGTYRDVDPEPSAELRAFLADVAGAERFAVPGLSASETSELLVAVSAPVDAAVGEAVYRRTGGNPFFVLETGRLMVASDDVPQAVLAGVPAGVGDAITRRLDRLPESVVEMLTSAAVLGTSAHRNLIAGVLGREISDDIAAAVVARIVRADDNVVTFEHDLFRETIVAGLAPGDTRRWHGRVVQAMRQTGATNAELAHHCVRSLPDGDTQEAIGYLIAAARDATRLLAYEEATGQLRRALALASNSAPVRLELDFAETAGRSGDYVDARSAFLAAARRTDDAGLIARAALGLHRLGTSSEGSHRDVTELLERAADQLDAAEDDAPAVRARVLGALARELADGPDRDSERAANLAERAVVVAGDSGDRGALAFCLFALHDVTWAPGTAARRLELAEQMAAAAGDDLEMSFEAAFCRMIALVDLGDSRFEVALREMGRIAERSRLPRQRFYVTSRLAMVAILRGEDADALRLIAEADAMGAMIAHPDRMGVRLTQLLVMGLIREGVAAARRLEREHGIVAPAEFEPEMRAFVALADGKPELAGAILRSSEPGIQRAQFRWRALAALAFDADIAAQAGAGDLCRHYYDALLSYADEVVDIGGATAIVGPVSYFLGLLAQALGRTAEAQRHFAAALDVTIRLGAAPLSDRIRAAQPTAGFQRDGDVWRLTFGGATITLPDAKGLHDIATLIAAPGVEISATDLAGVPAAGADPMLDDTARAAYRRRLTELDEALDRADAADRPPLQDERDALIAELTHAAGLGGRRRRLGDAGERARTAVTARIRDTIRRIAVRHPQLAAHLQQAIVTGRTCCYRPAEPVRWHL